jgi:GntR family transcriptional regulator/MocR family aminotransferase
MISIDKTSDKPLYHQLYEELKRQIIDGELRAGYRLPATRTLAATWSLSRNTVVSAYKQLEIEGYITGRAGSGYYVEKIPAPLELEYTVPSYPRAEEEADEKKLTYDFRYTDLDLNIYLTRAFRQSMANAWARAESRTKNYYDLPEGSYHLRASIARELHALRGVNTRPEQIILTGGHYYSLLFITRFFPRSRYSLLMEDPGYPAVWDIFQQEKYDIDYIPVTEEGVDTSRLHQEKNKILYLTPSHQYPMGYVLPINKRIEILNWAVKTGSYIIENDYDSELRYQDLPIPSLQSIDKNRRVIYMGTFSKSTSPDLRISYVVMPMGITVDLRKRFPRFSPSLPLLIEDTLSDYIDRGEYRKRLNTIRTYSRKKHDFIISSLKKRFGSRVKIHGTGGGLHFVLELDTSLKEREIIDTLAASDVRVYSMKEYWAQKERAPENLIFIGYGGIPLTDLPKYMAALGKGLEQVLAK